MNITEPYTIFPRKLPSGKVVYYYQFRDEHGVRSAARSTGCDTLPKAKRVCQGLYNSGQMGGTGGRSFAAFAVKFFDDKSDWREWKRVAGRDIAPATLMSYNEILKHKIMPFFGKAKLKDITTADVKRWVVWARKKWSAKTTNNAQSVLNIILKAAKEEGLIDEVPSAGLAFRRSEKHERELLTIEEIKAVAQSPLWTSKARRLAFKMLVVTGMRVGEALAITAECIDIKRRCIDVKQSMHKKFGLGRQRHAVAGG